MMPISSTKTNPAAVTSVQRPMSAGLIVVILSTLLGIQPVTTDLYLLALPTLTESLAAPMPLAQRTLSALLLAFGCAQLLWGPLSNRFGRRPILLCRRLACICAPLGGLLAELFAWTLVPKYGEPAQCPTPMKAAAR